MVYTVYGKKPILFLNRSKFLFSNVMFYFLNKYDLNHLLVAFQFGWRFRFSKESIPSSLPFLNNSTIAISQPFTPRHIYHFSESVNHLLLLLRYPNYYPNV